MATTDRQGINVNVQSLSPALVPYTAVIDVTASGIIVPAVDAKRIVVVAFNLMAAGGVKVRFKNGAAGAYISGPKYIGPNGGIAPGFLPPGWFNTDADVALYLELSVAIAVGGEVIYVQD